jgi:hypothetical protein
MSGRRKNNPLNLEPRVYAKHGAFYYVHKDNRWEKLGSDIAKANELAQLYNSSRGMYGTMEYWLDIFVDECQERVKSGSLSRRTLEDYRNNIKVLKIYFAAPMSPIDIEPIHVQEYLEICAKAGRPVRGNRERAALSACISWLIRTRKVEGLTTNPCTRAGGIKRNPEPKSERHAIHKKCHDVLETVPEAVHALVEFT